MARSTYLMFGRRTIFHERALPAAGARGWPYPFVSRGNSLDTLAHVALRYAHSPQRKSNCSKLSPTRR